MIFVIFRNNLNKIWDFYHGTKVVAGLSDDYLVGEREEECLFSETLNLWECIVMVASSEPFINHGAVY